MKKRRKMNNYIENGFNFEALSKPFEFSCHNYSLDALESAKHLHELKKENDGVWIYIDGQQRGVGGDIPASNNERFFVLSLVLFISSSASVADIIARISSADKPT